MALLESWALLQSRAPDVAQARIGAAGKRRKSCQAKADAAAAVPRGGAGCALPAGTKYVARTYSIDRPPQALNRIDWEHADA
jgi:hypothetical protein